VAAGIAALLIVVMSGLEGSRSSGNSANALQVADAGVNAAVQFIPTLPASIATVSPQSATVGSGTYTYSATKVSNQLWNVTSIGRDASGRQRLIKAQAVAVPLFGQPIYVKSLTNYFTGSVLESYSDSSNICTKEGFLTVEDPLSLKWTSSGGGNANCQRSLLGNADWKYTVDGCRYPGLEEDLDDPLPLKASPFGSNDDLMGDGRCPPPPDTKRTTPKLDLRAVDYPDSGVGNRLRDYTCDPTEPATATDSSGGNYTSLTAGTVYVARAFTLRRGCSIQLPVTTPPTPWNPEKATKIFAGSFIVGSATGSSNEFVNPPQAGFKADASSTACPAYAIAPSGAGHSGGFVGSTAYCKLWPAQLELHVTSSAASSTCTTRGQTGCVWFNKQLARFWGVVNAPEGNVKIESSNFEMFGASVSKAFDSDSQFRWYFDAALLKAIGSGRWGVANWREEPLGT
jgi:hypothetical protein